MRYEAQTAAALAHARNIVPRDLKSNIIITSEVIVKVLDPVSRGASLPRRRAKLPKPCNPSTGDTLAYMPPES